MATAAHRRPRSTRLRRRAGGVTLAGAVASVSSLTVLAPAAQADDHNVWDRVADCESSGRWDINTGNGYYGGLQFWHPTWTGFGGKEFADYAHQATKVQQVTVAQRVLKVQGPGAWPVCSVRAGLTMENGSAPYPGGDTPAPAPAPVPAPEPPAESGTYTVTAAAGANIRSGPSTSYGVVGGAAHGTRLAGQISTNGWLKLSDGRGWISGTIVAPVSGTPTPAPAPAPAPQPPAESGTYTVTAAAGANIRSGPSTSYGVVGGAAHGTKLAGQISTNGWLKLSDGRGWISGTIVAPASGGSGGSAGGGGTSTMAPLALDGSRGPLTVKAIQRWAGVSETGRWDNGTIKALQRTVGTNADGLWGPASQAALQSRIGLTRDGSTYMNYRTVVALQKYLNANVIG
ncbi:transglycosylase family protein [Ornithinimicrobium pekingense]|uniref:Transglycosylase n=1 Tax=Ornithinimicrobium pekingense TaxID=384677 RepID=A0ABQ2FCW4_9MICO|nr:transglycosylase family protein [Ornithinimicrobium pekingense]GGK76719.1 transglycosylase [Ornithinimicrobium pekingense]